MVGAEVFTLINDHITIKEAFIIDELQSYMDLKDPSNPQWITPVRVRLQEKKDWEQKVKEVILRELKGIDENELNGGWWETSTGVSFGKNKLNKILKELGLEDEE